jgi:acyl-coenzyme A thioesterase PaaI-like protein
VTDPSQHVVAELGLAVDVVGDELHGTATVHPEMFVPGTSCLRLSILATWADHVAGLVAGQAIRPRVGVTLDLDVHVHRQPVGLSTIRAVARPLKIGRSVVVVGVELTADDGIPAGIGTASFMAAPDAGLTLPPLAESLAMSRSRTGRLTVPFAERARCERREPGVAVLAVSDDGINASQTLNGGLLALVVEEAALSAAPGTTLASLAMRYLRPVRVGPVVASADVRAELARVEVRDAGSDDRVAVAATTRSFHGLTR